MELPRLVVAQCYIWNYFNFRRYEYKVESTQNAMHFHVVHHLLLLLKRTYMGYRAAKIDTGKVIWTLFYFVDPINVQDVTVRRETVFDFVRLSPLGSIK